jgi:hypothetical protein
VPETPSDTQMDCSVTCITAAWAFPDLIELANIRLNWSSVTGWPSLIGAGGLGTAVGGFFGTFFFPTKRISQLICDPGAANVTHRFDSKMSVRLRVQVANSLKIKKKLKNTWDFIIHISNCFKFISKKQISNTFYC